MAKSVRRPQQIFAVAMWLLSFLFAAAFIGLGSLIIADLPRVDKPISLEQFVPAEQVDGLRKRRATLSDQRSLVERRVQDAESEYATATADYQSAKANFDNWAKTRSVTEETSQNQEVLSRTRAVEILRNKEREALARLEAVRTERVQIGRNLQDAEIAYQKLLNSGQADFVAAQRWEVMKAFLMRLALTVPLLLVAGYLVAKKRKSSYWPLYRGFVLFALFAFFVELVPYLPSYGGYIRFIVGIILVAVVGHYAIRAMGRYLERKREEESRSEKERRQSIEYETALKKIASKTCPGCDRSVVLDGHDDTFFCVHCGMRLREKCESCGESNLSFHRYCLSCGEKTNSAETLNTGSQNIALDDSDKQPD